MVNLWVVVSAVSVCWAKQSRHNVVFILTDDLDFEMNGMHPLEKTRKLLGDEGATFENTFVTTPVCCPSRSTILTGKYQHNTRVVNNTIAGNCSSTQWQETMEPMSVGVGAKKLGYNTFYAGKYLNQYGFKAAGGVGHVPLGWDIWNGLVGNSRYFNYSLSRNGKEEKHGNSFEKDYLTDLLANDSVSYIEKQTKETNPFFMVVATPAPHEPWTFKPKYKDLYSNVTAPRDNKQWNVHKKDAHWVVRNAPSPMSNTSINWADNAFRNRWRTLKSVDDLVEDIYNALNRTGQLNNTYIIFSSDHGYHTGQFSLPYDKRHMYEFDIRVPLLLRGPGIKPGSSVKHPVAAVDFAPSIIDLMNPTWYQNVADHFDGQSFLPLVDQELIKKVTKPDNMWRENILIEYHGEGRIKNANCPDLGPGVSECVPDCVCEDAWNNTYTCIRQLKIENDTISHNLIYCEFVDSENYIEVYDLNKDAVQLQNIRTSLDPQTLESLNMQLIRLSGCKGSDCSANSGNPFGSISLSDPSDKKLHFSPSSKTDWPNF